MARIMNEEEKKLLRKANNNCLRLHMWGILNTFFALHSGVRLYNEITLVAVIVLVLNIAAAIIILDVLCKGQKARDEFVDCFRTPNE